MNRVELALITNKSQFARRAERAGIDRIMIDLERLGKAKRQCARQLFLSDHYPVDIDRLRSTLSIAAIQVRLNSWNLQSFFEINDVISRGAQVVMLPMVRDREDPQAAALKEQTDTAQVVSALRTSDLASQSKPKQSR
jgi:2-keto-3-deoxy-L-rhamnonate aldolase RhmA